MEEQKSQGMQALIPETQGRPTFEPGPGWGAKFKKNFTKRILPLTAIAVVMAGLIMFLTRDGQEAVTVPGVETEKTQLTEEVSRQEVKTETGQQKFVYEARAQKGEGITHLARKILKEYLNTNPSAGSGLLAEHKIYIEDYLKDLRGEKLLKIGQEIEFSESEITKAIEMAKDLSENQLANLSQFVPVVSGL